MHRKTPPPTILPDDQSEAEAQLIIDQSEIDLLQRRFEQALRDAESERRKRLTTDQHLVLLQRRLRELNDSGNLHNHNLEIDTETKEHIFASLQNTQTDLAEVEHSIQGSMQRIRVAREGRRKEERTVQLHIKETEEAEQRIKEINAEMKQMLALVASTDNCSIDEQ